jgi:hypothetical protein
MISKVIIYHINNSFRFTVPRKPKKGNHLPLYRVSPKKCTTILLPFVSNRFIVYVIRNFLKWKMVFISSKSVHPNRSYNCFCEAKSGVKMPVEISSWMKFRRRPQALNWKAMNHDLPNLIHVNFQIREDYVISFLQLGWRSYLQNPLG